MLYQVNVNTNCHCLFHLDFCNYPESWHVAPDDFSWEMENVERPGIHVDVGAVHLCAYIALLLSM